MEGQAVVWVAEGGELGVGGEERIDSLGWWASAWWIEVCGGMRTLALATGLVYCIFCFVVFHGRLWLFGVAVVVNGGTMWLSSAWVEANSPHHRGTMNVHE